MIGLPSTWPILGAVVASAFAAGVAGGWTANGWRLEGQVEQVRREHSDQVAAAARRVADEQARQRAIELQRTAAQQEVAHVASIARTRDQADRHAADVLHRRMLDAAVGAAVSAGRACHDPAAAGSREAAAGTLRTMADVLGEASASAGEMAAAADDARTAGSACERYVDALTNQP